MKSLNLGYRQKAMLKRVNYHKVIDVASDKHSQRIAGSLYKRGYIQVSKTDGLIVAAHQISRPRELLRAESELLDKIELLGVAHVTADLRPAVMRLHELGQIELIAQRVTLSDSD